MNLFGIAAHLYYTEPSNLALVALLRNGVLHKVCGQSSFINAKRDFIILMAHLFGRKYLPKSYTTDENIKLIIKKSPSIVILPPLPEVARKVQGKRLPEPQNRRIARPHQMQGLPDPCQTTRDKTPHPGA